MKIKIYVFAIFLALLGCTRGFEELQKNPNLPEDVNPGLLLPSIIFLLLMLICTVVVK